MLRDLNHIEWLTRARMDERMREARQHALLRLARREGHGNHRSISGRFFGWVRRVGARVFGGNMHSGPASRSSCTES